MIPVGSRKNPAAGTSVVVALVVVVVLVWLGATAPADTHPFFYFGLAFLGGGAVALLFSGVAALMARSRTPTAPWSDLQFFAGVRRAVLAMWLCALVTDVLGTLIVLAIAGGRGGSTPLGTETLIVTFVAATVTVVCAGITSFATRRLLPRS